MERVKIISRPKLNGLGRHYGVMLNDQRCYDLQPYGIRRVCLDKFSHGLPIKVVQEMPLTSQIDKRLNELKVKGVKYRLFRYNCESFARHLVTGKAESKQVRVLAISSAIGSVFYYIFRPSLSFLIF